MRLGRKGVSEVVGSVLVLLITLTMFTTVVLWVLNYPTPTGRTHVDLQATLEGQWINITHQGGERLKEDTTGIYVSIDGDSTGKLKITNSSVDIGDDLNVGETWSKNFTTITSNSTVDVLIVAEDTGEVIYEETLQGKGVGNNPPIVAFAYSDPSAVPADNRTLFSVTAYVIDPDYDVTTCTVDLSAIDRGIVNMSGIDNVFESDPLTIPTDTAVGYYIFKISVNDSKTNSATGYGQMTVVSLPSVSGYFAHGDDITGYDIYNETGLVTRVGTRVFSQGEKVYVQVGSVVIRNLELENTCILYTGLLRELKESTFYRIPSPSAKFYLYECNFTAPTTPGRYLVYVSIMDTDGNKFRVWDTIYVRYPDGSVPHYPKLVTCKDPNGDGNLTDLQVEDTFKYTEQMYVKVITKDITAIESTDMGDVEINNLRGTWHIKKKLPTPPTTSNPPLSALFINSTPASLGWEGREDGSKFYTFSIDLLNPNKYGWLKGENTYVLLIRYFEERSEAGEEYGILATLVNVVGAWNTVDVVATVGSSEWLETDNAVFWYNPETYWDRTRISGVISSARALAVGDVDDDGDKDVVVGCEANSNENLAWFENLEPEGSKWLSHFITTASPDGDQYKVQSIALADLDYDGDLEIIAGMKDPRGTTSTGIHIYRNDGDWTDILLQPMTGGIARPIKKAPQDTTGSNLTSAQFDDNVYYNVSVNTTLYFTKWNTSGMSGDITGVCLWVQYKTDNGYMGDKNITWALNGTTLQNTTIQPQETSDEITDSFDLFEQGVDTFTEIGDLNVSFENNDYVLYKNYATSENTILGDRTNDLASTKESDNVYESIKEVTNRFWVNGLEHQWNITLSNKGYAWEFRCEGYCSQTSAPDNFTFYYSTDGVSWSYMLAVNNTTDTDTYQTFVFPEGALEGLDQVYIKVNDTNRSTEDNAADEQDKVYIDHMYVKTKVPGTRKVYIDYMWIEVIATTSATTTAIIDEVEMGDIDQDSYVRPDIVAADEDGKTLVYFNNPANPKNRSVAPENWVTRTLDDVRSPSAKDLIELGFFEGAGDTDLDIVRTNGETKNEDNLFIYKNPKGEGKDPLKVSDWTRDAYDPTGDRPISALAVGDMNQDGLQDITLGTEMINANDRPQLWQIRQGSNGSLQPPIRIKATGLSEQINPREYNHFNPPCISDIEIGDLDGDGDNDTVVGVHVREWWSWRDAFTNNLWAYFNNCTETTPDVDPDGDGSSGPTEVLWYREVQIYVNPWNRDAEETVFNIELGCIDA